MRRCTVKCAAPCGAGSAAGGRKARSTTAYSPSGDVQGCTLWQDYTPIPPARHRQHICPCPSRISTSTAVNTLRLFRQHIFLFRVVLFCPQYAEYRKCAFSGCHSLSKRWSWWQADACQCCLACSQTVLFALARNRIKWR